MNVEIYIWNNASSYTLEDWMSNSEEVMRSSKPADRIIFNHYIKQYRKNFKCTTHQLTTLIKKAKTMDEKESTVFIV